MTAFLNRWLNEPLFIKVLVGLVSVLVIFGIVRFFLRKLTNSIENPDLRYRMRKAVIFFGYLIAILLLAGEFSNQLHNVAVALGVASAGIAFALQEVIVSVAGWIAISFGSFYKIGDRVQLSGTVGDVIDIGIFSTTLMELGEWVGSDQYSGRVVRVANSFVFTEPVYNYSADFHFLWDEIRVPIMYGSDIQLARSLLQEAASEIVQGFVKPAQEEWKVIYHKYRIEHESIDPAVTLVANDNWLEFTLRYIVDFKMRRTTKDKLFMSFLEKIQASNNQVKIASTTVQLVEPNTFNINLNEKRKTG
jgi:small-conductance mechanosensitive channel